jgi:hypothetical protein
VTRIDLYIDFDGVLNFLRPANFNDSSVKSAVEQGYRLQWLPENIEWLNGLPDNVNMVWLTTWNADNLAVDKLTPLLGITRPVSSLGSPLQSQSLPWWKQSALVYERTSKGESNPYIWIDDDLQYEEPWRWPSCKDRLLVSPSTSYGVTAVHREQVDSFIASHS